MAHIVYDLGNKALQLGAESVVRPFIFGTNWQQIRIGIRLAIVASSEYLPTTMAGPRLGICTGNTCDISATTVDALWIPFWSGGGLTFTAVQPIVAYPSLGTSTFAQQRVGTTTSIAGTTTTSNQALSLTPSLRCLMIVDITKGVVGNSSATLSMWSAQSTTIGVDRSSGEFMAAMESPTVANADSDTWNLTLPLRTAKDWDSMFISWIRSVPPLNIFQMSVVRVQ